ncbi:hypothetical protein WR25_07510 [Diploscapter pachys]|uniref:Uncharacterized protein n=1 Tax=Diploscapter pachys TaxID=2018661 RepID=A0A2A2JKN0_9BILA|nr:hypothetical protein WR25_07510 [Diploscapter pachys]
MDRSKMPDFYDSQNNEIKMIIAAIFEKSADLEEFARTIMSIKPMLNNPDEFNKWLKNEEVEFEEPPIQEDMKEIGGDNSFDNSQTILFYRPAPPEWREWASVAYFKDKLYYLGGKDAESFMQYSKRVDLLMEIAERYIDYQTMNGNGLKLESFQNNEFISELHR